MFSLKIGEEYIPLSQINDSLNNIPNINRGGCAILAYSLYISLKKNNLLNEDTAIIYLFDGEDHPSYTQNLKFLNGDEIYANSCSHAVLYHNGKYIDSCGIFDNIHELPVVYKYFDDFNLEVLKIPQNKTKDFIKNSLENGGWNDMFDRKIGVKEIEEILNIKLKLKV